MSHIAMVPHNLSEWRAFFPYAKLMDAKSLWFNFRVWAGSSIDNVDPKVFPSGVAGFKAFSDDASTLITALGAEIILLHTATIETGSGRVQVFTGR